MFPLRYLTVTSLVKIVTYLNITLSRRHMMQNTYLSIIAFFLKMVHLEHLKNTVLNTYKKQIVWVDNLNVFKIWKCLQLGMKYFRNPFFIIFLLQKNHPCIVNCFSGNWKGIIWNYMSYHINRKLSLSKCT